jgi:GTP pyrophosphokinase
MQRPKYAGQPVARIYDRLGVRVLLDDVKDCYAALGVVHSVWKPIPGEFDDYIANPKTSGYQSLHTAVFHEGEPLEIQIRTDQMHEEAERGIAAHWKYKQGKAVIAEADQKLAWLRQLLEWQKDLADAREFVRSVRLDLFQNEVFVFTPKGDVIDLPAGAAPVSPAGSRGCGHHTVGARSTGGWFAYHRNHAKRRVDTINKTAWASRLKPFHDQQRRRRSNSGSTEQHQENVATFAVARTRTVRTGQ